MVFPLRVKQFHGRTGYTKSVIVSNAAMLTLNSVPVTILTAPTNSQYAICIIEIFARITAGTAYASVNNITFQYSGGNTIATLPGTGFLDQTAATGVFVDLSGGGTNGVIVAPATAITMTCGTGNPTTGTSPLTLKIKYKIHAVK